MKTLVFIDSGVTAYQNLGLEALPGVKVFVLDPLLDGIRQISAVLAGQSDVTSLHIVSHGSHGGFYLGNTFYDSNTLQTYGSDLQGWAASLTSDADILLYGCNVAAGEAGMNFVQQLSQLTGADVVASNDLTGNLALGGDWDLEVATGEIESPLAFHPQVLANYSDVLAPIRIQAEDYRVGGAGVAYFDTTPTNQGGVDRTEGVDIEATTDVGGGFNVGWIRAGEWLTYDVTVPTAGTYNLVARVASGVTDAQSMRVSTRGQLLTTLTFGGTGGWQTWADATATGVILQAGSYELRLDMLSSDFNLNYIELVRTGDIPPDTVAPTPSLTAPNISAAGAATYDFTVTYSDNQAIDVSTIDINDVQVTGPDGTILPVTQVSVSSNGIPQTATYRITAPGGTWDANDNGTYTIAMRANQVRDTSNNAVAANSLGSFQVGIGMPPPSPTPIRIQAENYRSGSAGVAYFDTTAGNIGGAYRPAGDIDIEATTDTGGGFNVGWIRTGEWLTYDLTVPTAGTYNLVARVATGLTGPHSMKISLSGQDLTTLTFGGTGGWQTWADATTPNVTLAAGTYVLRLDMLSSDFNLNYIDLIPVGADVTAPTASLNAANITSGGGITYDFSVAYSDNQAIDVSTIDASDVSVTGPGGAVLPVSLVSVSSDNNGTPRRATYRVTAPGGTWDAADDGTYTIAMPASQVRDTSGNAVATGTLGSFQVSVGAPPSTIRIQAEDYKVGSAGTTYLDTTPTNLGKAYRTDAVDIEATTDIGGGFNIGWIGAGEWLTYDLSVPTAGTYNIVARVASGVVGPHGMKLSLGGQDLTTLTFGGTGGWQTWGQAIATGVVLDAGTHTLRLDMLSSDFNLNYIELVRTGAATPDTIPPTATIAAASISTEGETTYDFTVTYSDNRAINVSTIDSSDIRVTGPGGFNQIATLVSVNSDSNGTPRTATYRITAPGATWNAADNGTYTISLLGDQVRDASSNAAASGSLGTFQVAIGSTPPPGNGNGLYAEYFDNADLTGLVLTRTDETVSFDWGQGSPDPTIEVDTFSVRWTGQVEPRYSETYTFYTTSDDGVRLWVNDQLLIDKWVDQGGTEHAGTIALTAGQRYNIRMEYYDNRYDAAATLSWSSASQPKQIIPRSQLYGTLGTIALADRFLEVDESAGTVTIQFQRTGNTDETASVDYTTVSGSAVAGSDFTATTGTLSFEAGETIKTVTIPILQNTAVESDETFSFAIDRANNAALGVRRTALVTIYDDDGPNALSFTQPNFNVDENAGTATVTVKRGGNVNVGTVTVDYTTSNGTAVAGTDYTATRGTLTFAPGERTKTIAIPINNDKLTERNETIGVSLSNPVGSTLGSQSTTTVTLIDDDPGTFVRQAVITGLTTPTSFDWTPDLDPSAGDRRLMYIAQKDGVVRVAENGTLLTTPFIDISAQVNNIADRGLLGVAVHPEFLSGNPYVYLLYTYDPPQVFNSSAGSLAGPDGNGNRPSRLIRLTADASTGYKTVVPGSEVVVLGKNSVWENISRPDVNSSSDLGNPPSGIVNGTTILPDPDLQVDGNNNIRDYLATDSDTHSVGFLKFAPDGSLFVSNGDGAAYGRVDPRAYRVQDLDNLSGKMLRIDPLTGLGLSDNPFYDNDPASNRSKVYSYGLRNPFRFAIHPTTGEPYIGDVGWTNWEEVNTGRGANFGWPHYEGAAGVNQPTGGYAELPDSQAFYTSGETVTPAIHARSHFGDNATALIMGDFYTGTTFPENYHNALFYNDVNVGIVDAIIFNQSGGISSIQRFDNDARYIVQMASGPDSNLYYSNIAFGEIGYWQYVPSEA